MSQKVEIGKKYNMLTVVEPCVHRNRRHYKCECECGGHSIVIGHSLISGHTKSCGCLIGGNLKHGMSGTAEHETWMSMKYRCSNENNTYYHIYGGRGIKVCERWAESFQNFYDDMGPKPSPDHSIDRIDVDGNYCPENCRWATYHQQQVNKQSSREVTGVRKRDRKTPWEVTISVDGKNKHLGVYDTKQEAAKVYDDKCEEIYGHRPNQERGIYE